MKLKADCKIAGETNHGSSIGTVRESCIKKFLGKITPSGVKLVSGVLIDCTGREPSPQFDLIAVVPDVLPPALLDDNIALVPVEAAILCIEVKSRLTNDSLKQIEKQNHWVSKAGTYVASRGDTRVIIPTCYLALESEVSQPNVLAWMKSNGNTPLGAVIGKHYMLRQEPFLVVPGGSDEEMLHFAADYFGTLQNLLPMRKAAFVDAPTHPLAVYLKGMAMS